MKTKAFLLGSLLVVLLSASVYANKMMSVDEKLQKMRSQLNLTQQEVEQARPIIQEYKDKMDRARQEKEDKLSRIFSPEQMNQLRSMKQDY